MPRAAILYSKEFELFMLIKLKKCVFDVVDEVFDSVFLGCNF